MIVLLALAVLMGQLHALGAAWAGAFVPDPFVCLAAFAGLYWPRRGLAGAALALGLGRALVIMEPAGGQVLCAWGALLVLASQREAFDRGRPATLAAAALLVAVTWTVLAWLLALISGAPVSAGLSLFTGAALAPLLARPAHRAAAFARLNVRRS